MIEQPEVVWRFPSRLLDCRWPVVRRQEFDIQNL